MPTKDRSLNVHFSNSTTTKICSYTLFLRSLGTTLLLSSFIVCITSATIGFLSREADSTSSIFVCSVFSLLQGILILCGSLDKQRYYRALKAGEILGFCNLILVVIGFLTNLEAWKVHTNNCNVCGLSVQQEEQATDMLQIQCSWFCDKEFSFWHIFLCMWLFKVGIISLILSCSVWFYFS